MKANRVNYLRKYQVDFIVKEDEGVVVARVKNPTWIPKSLYNFLSAHPFLKAEDAGFFSPLPREYTRRLKSMRGIAKCDPKDIFDVDTGKKIAFMKLRRKYNAYLMKVVNKLINFHIDMQFELSEFYEELNDLDYMDEDRLNDYGTAAEDNYPN